jgi:hypothetical protein
MLNDRETKPVQVGAREIEERRRMRANCFSVAAVISLLLIGGWVENGLVSTMRDSQNCYRPGASHCAAIFMPLPPRSVGQFS